MQKRVWVLVLALVFSITACGPQPEVRPASVASIPTASPTLAPTVTRTVEASPTPTDAPLPTATPAPTDTPLPAPAAAPDCMAINGVPFAFLPDNRHFLFMGEAGVQSFDLQAKQSEEFLPVPFAPGLPGKLTALSPQGDRLALALSDNSVQVYDTASKKLLHTLTGHTDVITDLQFSPDGKKLYTASHDTWVRVWDRVGKPLGAFQPTGADGIPNQVLGMGLSPDGKLLATIPLDGKTKIWDAENFTLVRELGASGGYENSDAVFSPDGQYLAAITANGLFLWSAADGAQLLGGNPGINAMSLAFSPDGRFLVYWDAQGNNEIVFLSADGSKTIRSLKTDAAPVWAILFSPDGSLMAAASNTETCVWRAAAGDLP